MCVVMLSNLVVYVLLCWCIVYYIVKHAALYISPQYSSTTLRRVCVCMCTRGWCCTRRVCACVCMCVRACVCVYARMVLYNIVILMFLSSLYYLFYSICSASDSRHARFKFMIADQLFVLLCSVIRLCCRM